MMKDKPKICVFCEIWKSGGIESFLFNVLDHINLNLFEIDIVAEEIGPSIFKNDLEYKGIHFVELSGTTKNIWKNRALFKRLLSEKHYAVLYLNAYQGMTLYYGYLAKQCNIKCRIIHSHNAGLRESKAKWVKLILHYTYSRLFSGCGTDFFACSKKAAAFLYPKSIAEKVIWIPNGIDVERFRFNEKKRADIRARMGLEGKYVIGNIGRLCYQKNQIFLLKVLSEVVKENQAFILILIGDGPDKEILQAEAKELDVCDKVVFFGMSSHVEELLFAMDLYAMPSFFEGLPITAIEAQATGLPLIYNEKLADEIKLSKNCCELQLSVPDWMAILLKEKVNENRIEGVEVVTKAGFDIDDVADTIELFLIKKLENICH